MLPPRLTVKPRRWRRIKEKKRKEKKRKEKKMEKINKSVHVFDLNLLK